MGFKFRGHILDTDGALLRGSFRLSGEATPAAYMGGRFNLGGTLTDRDISLVGVIPPPAVTMEVAPAPTYSLAGVIPPPVMVMDLAPHMVGVIPPPVGAFEVTPVGYRSLVGVIPPPVVAMEVTPAQVIEALAGVIPPPVMVMDLAPHMVGVIPPPGGWLVVEPAKALDIVGVISPPVGALEVTPVGMIEALVGVIPPPAGFALPLPRALVGVIAPPVVAMGVVPVADGIGRAIVVNVSNGAPSRYEGFNYRRLFQAGNNIIGVGQGGLEALFDGQPAAWTFTTGFDRLSANRVAVVESVYQVARGSGEATLILHYDGQSPTKAYRIVWPGGAGFDVIRTKPGKGRRGHRAALEVSGDTQITIRNIHLRILGRGKKL